MTTEKRIEIFDGLTNYFPIKIKQLLLSLPQRIKTNTFEIRLRAGRPLALTLVNGSVFISKTGNVCYLVQQGLYIVEPNEVAEAFNNMCEHSVYAHAEQIRKGYLSLNNGCRAGIAASAVYENGEINGFTAVSSINIRIASEHIGCAVELVKFLNSGLIIAGPPSSGKTSLLRDCVRIISNGLGTERKRVAVIDTRGEIASVNNGIPENDVGYLTDIITGCEKEQGIEIALRTLNPQVIAFDEIASLNEAKAVVKSFFAGAQIITTVHSGSIEEIFSRAAAKEIISSGVVKYVCFVSYVGAEIDIYKVLHDKEGFTLEQVVKTFKPEPA